MKDGLIWWPHGFSGDKNKYYSIFRTDYTEKVKEFNNRTFYMLNEQYGLSADPFYGSLRGISFSPDYAYDAENGTVSNLLPIEAELSLLRGSKEVCVNHGGGYWNKKYDVKSNNDDLNALRWIESCRLLQRFDFFGLEFCGDRNVLGRLEVTAFKNYFVLRPEFYAHERENSLGYNLKISLGKDFSVSESGGKIIMKNASGEGAVLVPLTNGLTFMSDGVFVTFSAKEEVREKECYYGFSVAVYPMKSVSADSAEALDFKRLVGKAEQIFPQKRTQEFAYDEDYGYWKLSGENTFSYQYGLLPDPKNIAKLDRIIFSLENPTDRELEVPLMVERSTADDFNPTGMCPMLRDAETGEPTGELIQRTNNWHKFDLNESSPFYAPENDPRRKWQGIWYHAHALIKLKPREKRTLEYTCTYASWGKGAFPVSHAQLSLIGYAGNQLWEQSALACFGESICYDPEMCLGRGNIDDIRPFQVDCGGKCNWSGNIGGGDFVVYYDADGNQKRMKNVRTFYRSQGPNMTDVDYVGDTIGDCIKAKINVKMGRTDDVVRIYYTLDYDFTENTEFEKFAFFQIGADNYASRAFDRYADGDESGVHTDCENLAAVSDKKLSANGKNPWWFLYKNSSGEKGNLLLIVREFYGEENGKPVPLCYRIGKTNDAYEQACIALVPNGEKFVPKGSHYRYVLEFVVLPSSREDYYGGSNYLVAQNDFNDSQFALSLCRSNILSAKALRGKILSVYPVAVESDKKDGSGVVAEIDFSGGLGYTPLVFENVGSYRAELQKYNGKKFEKVDQSLYGNDFWQVAEDGGRYRITYNVPCGGRYRLVEKQ